VAWGIEAGRVIGHMAEAAPLAILTFSVNLFSIEMALPARLLVELPPQVTVGARSIGAGGESGSEEGFAGSVRGAGSGPALSLGIDALDALLPDAGLPRGSVVELSVAGGAAFGSSLALAACRSAQVQARLQGHATAWCAFVDPTASLHAPAVAAMGVDLERLLVVRPPLEALSRVAVRLAESRIFTVVVVDLLGVPGAATSVPLNRWVRGVRRLALATASTDGCVLLLTAREAPRPLPLPVALRLELQRVGRSRLRLQIAKDRQGRLSGPYRIELAPGLRTASAGAVDPRVSGSGGGGSAPPPEGGAHRHVDSIAG